MASESTKNSTIVPPAGASRRDILRASAITAAATIAFPHVITAQVSGANDKIRVASVGCGGKGDSDVDQVASRPGAEIVALCDVDENTLNKKAQKFPKAKLYRDFRKMFDEMAKSIDAVTVSTPDHCHGIVAGTAMKLGKHVYCQKPFTQTVYEARTLRKLAKDMKVATQMGNQGSAGNGLRRAVEVIQAGIIGNPLELHVWSNRPIWPQGIPRPAGEDPVPPTLDWDLWLGPAAQRPFKKGVYHGFNWRGWFDFGTGALGDMACHTVNMPFRALKLGYPNVVECEATSQMFPETFPKTSRIRFEFPEREGLPPLKFWWYDGNPGDPSTFRPKPELTKDILVVKSENGRLPGSGALIIGDKGQVFSPDDYGSQFYVKLTEDAKFKGGDNHEAVKAVPQSIPRAPGPGGDDEKMKNEWFRMMREGTPGYSNFDIAAYLTEIILLGCIAMRVGVGRKMDWDGPNMKSTNIAEAAQFVKRNNRAGFDLI
ncbi:MAG: Gfo/Idh/MocA family protein [Tepidisphaerales bacterium]